MKYFYYAMGLHARDEALRLHDSHPDQQNNTAEKGIEIRMPGGVVGYKR